MQEEKCVKPPAGKEFDPISTRLTVLKNTLYRRQYTTWGLWADGSKNQPMVIPQSEVPGPQNPAELRYNTPELICVFVPRHTPATVPDLNNMPVPQLRQLQTELFYRVHSRDLERSEFLDSGEILWAGDTETRQLPAKHEGFRLKVEFDGGDRRIFTSTGSYGPLEVRFDPASRVIVLRPTSPP